MSTTYVPKEGSIAWKVIEFFTTNPEEVLTTSDLESKFDKPATQFHSLLSSAVASGALRRSSNDEDELVYSLGNGNPQVQPNRARNPSLHATDALVRGASLGLRKAPLAIDMDAIPLRDDVPLPDRNGRKLDFTRLFKRMAVLPIAVRSVLNKACTQAKTNGLGEFAIRVDTDETVAVWRTA